MTSTRRAVLFDIDGTLLDTNYFHSVSWWYALREAGEDIPMARIHPLIGMGTDQLLKDLLGEEREGLSDLHSKYYRPYKKDLHAFPKAAELLSAVARRGVQVVLARRRGRAAGRARRQPPCPPPALTLRRGRRR